MKLECIYNVVNDEIQGKYKTKVECAKKMGITRQRLSQILTKLKTNSGITYKKVEEFLNLLGYEIVIKKRG